MGTPTSTSPGSQERTGSSGPGPSGPRRGSGPGGLGQTVRRLGGMLVQPRRTLRQVLAGEGGDVLEVLLLFVAVRLLLNLPALYKSALLVGEAPGPVGRRLWETLWGGLRHDLVVFLFAAAAFAVYGRVLSGSRTAVRDGVAAVAYAAVPYAALQLLAAAVAPALDQAWWLPHHAVDAPWALATEGKLSMTRFAIKCAIAYGPGALLLLDAGRGLWSPEDGEGAKADEPVAPQAAPAGAVSWVGPSVLGLLLVAAGTAGAVKVVQTREELRPLLPGDQLPHEVTLPMLVMDRTQRAGTMSMGNLRGQVTIVDFWASWCAPCMRELPELSQLQQKYGAQGLKIVAINREPRAQKDAREAWRRLNPHFPSLVDLGAGTPKGFGERIGLQSLPTTLVVDRSGIVRHLHLGYTPPEVFEREVVELLKP